MGACAEAVLGPEVLPKLTDCNQQKHVGLVVELFFWNLQTVWTLSVAG